MNLSRAKSILIIAFIGLNIFLGYHLFWPDFGRLTRVAITVEDKRIIEEILNQNNYFLETSLDRTIKTSDFLTVSPDPDLQRMVRERLIEENASVYEYEDSTYYLKAEETAVFKSSGLIQILYDPGVFVAEDSINLGQREIRGKVEQFLNENQLMPEGIMFDYLEKIGPDRIVLYYYQVINNMPVYTGQLEVMIDLDQIREIEIYWLEPLERSPVREMEVISAAEALSNLVKEIGPSIEPRKIHQIELGFFSGEYDAEKWEIPPVWRIVLEGNIIYYINAFTGNLEKDILIPEQVL